MKRSRQGFLKRQKELARQAKRRLKEEKKAGKKDGEVDPDQVEDDDGEDGPEGLDFHAADGVLANTVEAVIPGETTVEEAEDPSEPKEP